VAFPLVIVGHRPAEKAGSDDQRSFASGGIGSFRLARRSARATSIPLWSDPL